MNVRVKICGIRSLDIMRSALESGADDVGLVFYPRSPRHVALAEASALAAAARGRARIVALTVDADDGLLTDIAREVQPDLLQLHGREGPERCTEIRQQWSIPVMKAIGVSTAVDVQAAFAYRDRVACILFDAKPPKDAVLPGGNGAAFDWGLIADIGGRLPFMLSGGLGSENVAAAIRATGARAVDVSSGVETAPGVKDPRLIAQFIAAAKSAHRAA